MKKRSIAFVLLLCAGSLVASESSFVMAKAKTSKGQKLLAEGKAEAAEKQFRKAVELESEWPIPRLGLSQSLVQQQRYDEALVELAAATDLFIKHAQEQGEAGLQQRQDVFREQQEFETFSGSRENSGTNSNVATVTANSLAALDTTVTRRFELNEVTMVPAEVFYLEGISHLRSGRRDLGMEALILCLELAPNHGLAHYNLAVALFLSGKAHLAKSHLDIALAKEVAVNEKFVADLNAAVAGSG